MPTSEQNSHFTPMPFPTTDHALNLATTWAMHSAINLTNMAFFIFSPALAIISGLYPRVLKVFASPACSLCLRQLILCLCLKSLSLMCAEFTSLTGQRVYGCFVETRSGTHAECLVLDWIVVHLGCIPVCWSTENCTRD
jgi:hypothetical protein